MVYKLYATHCSWYTKLNAILLQTFLNFKAYLLILNAVCGNRPQNFTYPSILRTLLRPGRPQTYTLS
jgi:hypothetical protein